MFFTIANVLNASELQAAIGTLENLKWIDGARTAGAIAKHVKRNQQADLSSSAGKALTRHIMSRINAHPVFKAAARPAKFSPLLVSRTVEAGGYGAHVDNAIMGQGENRLRTDLSFTLFLSEPETYEGGSLVLDLPGGVQTIKPAAGDMILYPSTLIHEVETVTSGERLAVVGWVQSLISNEAQRQILFDLEQVRMSLRGKEEIANETLMPDKVFSNLLRQWVDI